jgi:hypothetical protein
MAFFRRGAHVATADARRPAVEAGSGDGPVHGCLSCRLVQRATRTCAECGGAMVAPLAGLRELMAYRDMTLVAERDMWLITALLAGGSMVIPFLLPVSLFTLGASAMQSNRRRKARRDPPIAAIEDTRAMPGPDAVSVTGVAAPLRARALRPWDGGSSLAAELSVRWIEGLFLRATASAPFVVGEPGADPHRSVIVTGVIRFAAPRLVYLETSPPEIRGDDPRLAAPGVPPEWRFAGTLRVDEVVEGARVRVTGEVHEEQVPERTSYRDGGVARVMRGTPTSPILVEPC